MSMPIRSLAALCAMAGCLLATGLPAFAQAPPLVTLYSFTSDATGSNADGAAPKGALIQANDTDFYGTASGGGAHGTGTLFRFSLDGLSLVTLHSFSALNSRQANTDGAYPAAALLEAKDGDFYGTAAYGGVNSAGTAFKIDSLGGFTALHAFSITGTDGAQPKAPLIQALDGNFYGTAGKHGNGTSGTAFQMLPDGTVNELHAFSYLGTYGANPYAPLIQATDGNLYGTTYGGGVNGNGALFEISPPRLLTSLYSFSGSDGSFPNAGLTQAQDGSFYGTTDGGGVNGVGTIFQLTGVNALNTRYTFGTADGAHPNALILASDGDFYGTTYSGGANLAGTIFKMTPAGAFTLLHSFDTADGAYPRAGLVQAADGNLYGTTYGGGAGNAGTLFCLKINSAPLPVLTSISPTSQLAGSPAFIVTAKGSAFSLTSLVNWTVGTTATALVTHYVSDKVLTAEVPAALIAGPGTAKLTVLTPGAGTSAAKAVTIHLTSLKLVSATSTRDAGTGTISVTLSLQNNGHLTAPHVALVGSKLGTAVTLTALPVPLGDLAAGAMASVKLTYAGSAGPAGKTLTLTVTAAFTGGKSISSLKVKLP